MKRVLQLLALFAVAFSFVGYRRPVVIPPCECTTMQGEARWAAKTDPELPPVNTAALPRVTPAIMSAWPAPAEKPGEARVAEEQQWYALICRIVAIKLEDDGDLHIEVENVNGGPGRVVVELPCGETWCEMRKHVVEWTKSNVVLKRRTLEPVVSPHNVTVVGKAFYDTDHAKKGTNQRRGKSEAAAWEIHPVMKLIDGDARLGSGL